MVVADIFRDQASPWEELARDHVHAAWKACRDFLKHAVAHVADRETSTAIMQKVVQPAMDAILVALKSKTGEILGPHQTIHPITYNHYFTGTIQNVRKERERARVTRVLLNFFHVTKLDCYSCGDVDLRNLAKLLVDDTVQLDMHRFAASEALDHMDAYYKVRRFLVDQ